MSPRTSPGATSNVTPSTACTPPNHTATSRSVSAAASADDHHRQHQDRLCRREVFWFDAFEGKGQAHTRDPGHEAGQRERKELRPYHGNAHRSGARLVVSYRDQPTSNTSVAPRP